MTTRNLSFSKQSYKDQMMKAKLALQSLEAEPLNEGLADSCAEEINKCIDYICRQKVSKSIHKTTRECRKEMRNQCPALGIMEDIADSVKHNGIDRPWLTIKESKRHQGGFSSGFNRGFDIARLIVKLNDNDDDVHFIDAAIEAIEFIENTTET